MPNEKIEEQISKLEAANGNLGVKIDVNKARMRTLVGKLAGVKIGDVVVSKGARYRVTAIVSEAVPQKGKPILNGLKVAKNGNLGKRPVEIRGAWSADPGVPKKNLPASPRRAKSARKTATAPAKRRPGRPRKESWDTVVLGTA